MVSKKEVSEKEIPDINDLEFGSNDESDPETKSNNILLDMAGALETILSEEHFDQKTIISSENEIGLIQIDTLQAHFLSVFGYEFPSLIALKNSKQEHAVSVGGKRSEQIVDIFKSMQTNIISSDVPKNPNSFGRLFGR